MEFVHLHIHTSFSLLNGVCKIKKLANKLGELGQKAAAITDHSNMFGVVAFYDALKEKNIKPIIGCEINLKFFGSVSHITVLCENEIGYKNLIKIVSNSYLENFNREAVVDFDFLKKYKEGLIFLSGCFKGEISKNILNNDFNRAKEIAVFFKAEFKEENFFLELQDFGFEKDIMRDVYTQILGISTIAAVVTAAVALLLMNFSKSGRTVDESRAWLKRIIITWAILNSLGFILAYVTPFFSGGTWTP